MPGRMAVAVANTLRAFVSVAASAFLLWVGVLVVAASGSRIVVAAYCTSLALAGALFSVLRWRKPQDRNAAGRALWFVTTLPKVLFLGLLGTCAGGITASRPPDLPRQAEVAQWLRQNRPALERLRELAAEDWMDKAEFGRLLTATGCAGVQRWPDDRVAFFYRSWGFNRRGWRVALVWSPSEPDRLVATIDGFKPSGEHAYGFSRLDGSWYAFVSWASSEF